MAADRVRGERPAAPSPPHAPEEVREWQKRLLQKRLVQTKRRVKGVEAVTKAAYKADVKAM